MKYHENAGYTTKIENIFSYRFLHKILILGAIGRKYKMSIGGKYLEVQTLWKPKLLCIFFRLFDMIFKKLSKFKAQGNTVIPGKYM